MSSKSSKGSRKESSTSSDAPRVEKRHKKSSSGSSRAKQGLFRRSMSLTKGLFGDHGKMENFAQALGDTNLSTEAPPKPDGTIHGDDIANPLSQSNPITSSSSEENPPSSLGSASPHSIESLLKALELERTQHARTKKKFDALKRENKAVNLSYQDCLLQISTLKTRIEELEQALAAPREQSSSEGGANQATPFEGSDLGSDPDEGTSDPHYLEETTIQTDHQHDPTAAPHDEAAASEHPPEVVEPSPAEASAAGPPPPPPSRVAHLRLPVGPSSSGHGSELVAMGSPRVVRSSTVAPKTKASNRPLPPNRGGSVDITLTNIDRSSRKLTQFDESILLHSEALKINLQCNLLSSLPATFSLFRQLEILDLSYNRFTELPSAICQLRTLKHLDLSGNRLNLPTSFPPEFTDLNGLTNLHLTRNAITTFPVIVGSLQSLEILVLHANKLEAFEIPEGAFPLLSSLDMSRNSLHALPDNIGQLRALTELNLSENCLIELPTSIGELLLLNILDLAQNSLCTLPASVGNLGCLESLDLSHNSLEELPYEISYLNRLTIFRLNHNRLTSLSELDFTSMESLRTLSCCSNLLTAIPTSLFHIATMWRLELAANQIDLIPADLGYLTSLRYLNLAFNQITSIPTDLSYMTELLEFNVAYNKIAELPAEVFASMSHLRLLVIAGNRDIQDLPESIWYSSSISTIYANSLTLNSLPEGEGVEIFPSLARIDVSDNQISSIPSCYASIEFLERFAIAHNKLSSPLPDFSYLYDLKELDFTHNLLTDDMIDPSSFERLLEKNVMISLESNAITEPAKFMSRPLYHHSDRFHIGYAEMIGRRPTMEDAFTMIANYRGRADELFIALYDGHSRADAALFAAKEHPIVFEELLQTFEGETDVNTQAVMDLLRGTFSLVNKRLDVLVQKDPSIRHCGSTGVLCYFTTHHCYFANVGDSRAVLSRAGHAIRLSYDHKPADDEERIRALGGNVVSHRSGTSGTVIDRVNGQLAVSRSIGDVYMHPWVTDDPYVNSISLQEQDQFIIIACDGVWDEVSDQVAVDIVRESLEQNNDPHYASAKLRDYAYALGSDDNISVITILLSSKH